MSKHSFCAAPTYFTREALGRKNGRAGRKPSGNINGMARIKRNKAPLNGICGASRRTFAWSYELKAEQKHSLHATFGAGWVCLMFQKTKKKQQKE